MVSAVGFGEDLGGEGCDDCTAREDAHQHQILLRRVAKQQVPGHRCHDQEQRRAEPDRKYPAARPADCTHALGAARAFGHVGEEDGCGEARDVPEAGADQSHTQCEILRHAVQGGRGQKADAALIAPTLVNEIVDEGESRRSDHQRHPRRGQAYEFLSGHDQFENCREHQCPAACGEDKPFGTVTEATVERPQCAKHKRHGDGSGDGKQGHGMRAQLGDGCRYRKGSGCLTTPHPSSPSARVSSGRPAGCSGGRWGGPPG